jgi:hypothetical protein
MVCKAASVSKTASRKRAMAEMVHENRMLLSSSLRVWEAPHRSGPRHLPLGPRIRQTLKWCILVTDGVGFYSGLGHQKAIFSV